MPFSDSNVVRQDLLRRLTDQPSGDLVTRLCCLATETIPCQDAVVVLDSGGRVDGPVASCRDLGARFAEAEFALGEGPTFAVRSTGRIQVASNLGQQLPESWPILGAKCVDFGIQSIASYPLQIGHSQLGALHALRNTSSPFDESGHQSGFAISDLVTDALLYLQSGLTEMDFIDLLASSDADRLRVHQATGMAAEMLGCSVADAMSVMRAKAFESDVTLYELSRRIVGREMRLES